MKNRFQIAIIESSNFKYDSLKMQNSPQTNSMATQKLTCVSIVGSLFATLACLILLPLESHGQEFTSPRLLAAQASAHNTASRAEREQLYKQLDKSATLIEQQYRHIKRIANVVEPTIVHVEAKKRQKSSASKVREKSSELRTVIVEEAGAGIIFEKNRRFYVMTNFHVVEDSNVNDIRLEAAGQVFYPVRLLHDRETDLSILEVSEPGLLSARIGNSDAMGVGDFVVAIGSPFGLSHSVSYGIISATGRHDLELGPQGVKYQNFFQTDASINPGNSGGPLINLRGEVIGVNTAIASNSGGSDGIGFSIPINMAMRVATDLIEHGFVRRGFLGVSLDAHYSPAKARAIGLRKSKGALISSITSNSPAANSDLKIGDVILAFGKQTIADDSQLVTTVSMTPINESVPVRVFRDGAVKTVYVTISERDSFRAMPTGQSRLER